LTLRRTTPARQAAQTRAPERVSSDLVVDTGAAASGACRRPLAASVSGGLSGLESLASSNDRAFSISPRLGDELRRPSPYTPPAA
jgi:hypothetical protein